MDFNEINAAWGKKKRESATLFTTALQLVYDACKMYSIYKLCHIYLSHHIAGWMKNIFFFTFEEAVLWGIKGRTRDTTQRSPQCFCQDYCTNPSPSPPCVVIQSHLRYNKANLIVKLTYGAIWKFRAINPSRLSPAFAGTLISRTSPHELHTCKESMWKKLHTHQGSGSEFYGAQSFLMCEWLTDTPDLHWDKSSSQL